MTSLLAAYGSDDDGSPPPTSAPSSSKLSAATPGELDAFNLGGLSSTPHEQREEKRLRDEVAAAPDVLLEVSGSDEPGVVEMGEARRRRREGREGGGG